MSYVINTNTNAMNAKTQSIYNNRHLSSSLEKLSSGFRINKASDDASGLAIADSLRAQTKGLEQAIRNANDAIGIIQIADKAMDEQITILETIRTKAIQSSQDGQTASSRKALQSDIVRLLEQLDNIASQTTYNGKSLLSGGFTNKKFQIGAYSHQTVNASIGATSSDKIGQTRFETGQPITQAGEVALRFTAVNGVNDVELERVQIGTKAGTGLGALVEVINKNANELQVRAKADVTITGQQKIGPQGANANSTIRGLAINGVTLGVINDVRAEDSDNKVVAAINNVSSDTGVQASINAAGRLELTSVDGRGIRVEATEGMDILGLPTTTNEYEYYGRLTLIRNDARDIMLEAINVDGTAISAGEATAIGFGNTQGTRPAETVINLRAVRGPYSQHQASAIGAHSSFHSINFLQSQETGQMATGVTTFAGAQSIIDIADTGIKMLDKIRADLGSVQGQLVATVNNISTTATNVKFSESQIRDVDYSGEISSFKKRNILVQAGNYALTQSNVVQQNVLKLLQ